MIREFLLRRARALIASRPPDFEVGPEGDRYMLRWWVIPRNRFFNVYLHEFLHDDEDRARHDHPWASCSVVLAAGYWEVLDDPAAPGDVARSVRVFRREGSITFRAATTAHRIVLLRRFDADHPRVDVPERAVSLFLTGPVVRTWGFWCSKGWVPWAKFVSARDKGAVGRGCE